eukprot:1514896-Prymnesium_polylepis.1
MASGGALQLGFFNGGLQLMMRSGMGSAMSVGGFLASYNGGVCSLERFRRRKDAANPFVVGGAMGLVGAIPGYLVQSPQVKGHGASVGPVVPARPAVPARPCA